jgi:aspartate kinase/aspartokinase/homoserine dehydrogenase 1
LNASIDIEVSSKNVKNALPDKMTYIIPGFYGVSPNGKINLLGRGGSDYSAAAIAACLDAETLDLWKDVKGFLSADPSIVTDAINVDSLTYEEAGELAYFGSKIIHPRTSEPLSDRQIPIRIFNISESDKGNNPLTIINVQGKITEKVIKSVSFNDNFGILKLLGSSVGIIPGILAKSTVDLNNEGINIQSVITSQTAINILLSSEDLYKAKRIIENRYIHGINELLVEDNISLIAAVGEGITSQHGIAGRIFGAVAKKEINIMIISFGASPVAIYFIVHKNDRDETIRAIHGEFFE